MVTRLAFLVLVAFMLTSCKRSTYPTGNVKEPTDKPAYTEDARLHPAPQS